MPTYAADTQVSSDRSRAEIERTLTRFGATSFQYGWEHGRAAVGFVMNGRRVRFVLPLPDRESREFTLTPTRRTRTAEAADRVYEQAVRQRWRALALMVKAKLEAVESGIVSFEDEFLPHTVLPSGRTVAEEVGVQVAEAYALGQIAPLQIEGGRR